MKIKEPTPEEIGKLLSFLPAFEKEGRTFGRWDVSKPEDEEKHPPYAAYDKDVNDFFEIASQPCFMTRGGSNEIISNWLEGDFQPEVSGSQGNQQYHDLCPRPRPECG